MLQADELALNNIKSPIRQIKGKAELYTSSAAAQSGKTIIARNVCPIVHEVKAQLKSKNIFNGELTIWRNADRIMPKECIKVKRNTWYKITSFDYTIAKPTFSFYGNNTGVLADGTDASIPTNTYWAFYSKDYDYVWFRQWNTMTQAGITLDCRVQIEEVEAESSPNTDYMPHIIDDYSGYSVTRLGKNLANLTDFDINRSITITLDTPLPAGTYTLSGLVTTTSSQGLIQAVYTDGSTTTGSMDYGYKSANERKIIGSKTYPKPVAQIIIYAGFGWNASAGHTAKFIDFMIEKGASATEYEPYIKPIEYTAAADGTITGITSLSPTMTLIPSSDEVMIEANYNGNTLLETYSHNDALQGLTIDRIGEEGKFFGFGVSQKLSVKLVDKDRAININPNHILKPYLTATDNFLNCYPLFIVDEINRDENTNGLTLIAYDVLKRAEKHTVSEISLGSYTVKEFAEAAAATIGACTIVVPDIDSFNINYESGANFEGKETIKEALNAIAEATQTIYYINSKNQLVFKRFKEADAAADLVITKADYITLDSKTNKSLGAIASITELGDNYTTSLDATGTTQYIRNNPFLELREDIATLLDNAIEEVGGLTINQFTLNWRGNYLLEIGDKVEIITKDNNSVFSYVINDSINYTGALNQKTSWSYKETQGTAANPTSIGEILKETTAKVDKQNKTIELIASEAKANNEAISTLKLTTDSINASVSSIEATIGENNESINELKRKVDAQITEEDITIKIQTELANGVDKVTTGKGFSLDDRGLTVEDLNPDTNNVINTTISNNGMTVYTNSNEVLKANDEGVKAQDLHATTYLIIGTNSRFEDYNGNRTGCFWIGG